VTALYEIVPVGKPIQPGVDPLKYQPTRPAPDAAASDELLTLKLRYKPPQADTSKLFEQPLKDDGRGFAQASKDTQFAAAVALFGMLLRHSEHVGAGNYGAVLEIAESASGDDATGYRREFVELVKKARQYAGQ
jgi:Ca-activated chloride channel family protein